jgi:hypothetical protein
MGAGCVRVSKSGLRIVVQKLPSREQVPGDGVRGLLRQRPEFAPDLTIEITRIEILRRLQALLGPAP